jgi:hypothetical protein
MANALAPRLRGWDFRDWLRIGLLAGLIVSSPLTTIAQDAKTKAGSEAAASKTDAADEAEAGAEGEAPAPVVDPSQTRKINPVEVFRDLKAEDAMDLKQVKEIPSRPASASDLQTFKAMPATQGTSIDTAVIQRVVDSMIANLTSSRNIQAVIDPNANVRPGSDTATAIQNATTTLLEPLFAARTAKNERFLTAYTRVLLQKLPPLLKNHLIPRVQAMIILGETASPDALKLFVDQIKASDQTYLVKLWALKGISNIKEHSNRVLPAATEIETAKVISDYLSKETDLPWPVQYRALETLGWLRQGFQPANAKNVEMAAVVMNALANAANRPEVRAEAAWALGMMPIGSAVPNANYGLIAHLAGELAAELGEQIAASASENRAKAEYLTGFLIGPLYQAFEGTPSARDSGLTRMATGSAREEVQQTFDLIKPLARSAVNLVRSGGGLVAQGQKDLTARVAALKNHLAKNPPKDLHLVPGGPEYPLAGGQVAEIPAPGARLAGDGRGR